MSHSKARRKPAKPRADFPLFAHNNGLWAKKILGKIHYFGVWADPDAAFRRYIDQKDALHAGRKPWLQSDEATVRDLVNRWLTSKHRKVESGEIRRRTFLRLPADCEATV